MKSLNKPNFLPGVEVIHKGVIYTLCKRTTINGEYWWSTVEHNHPPLLPQRELRVYYKGLHSINKY